MGGGNLHILRGDALAEGLSPRGRGKLTADDNQPPLKRSIPAWAGETIAGRPHFIVQAVYPRVGGGNDLNGYRYEVDLGLSPRGRGKRGGLPQQRRGGRSIPAWAGETQNPTTGIRWQKVYPRVGGGNTGSGQEWRWDGGLSPRGRGKRAVSAAQKHPPRSIPAWAGET